MANDFSADVCANAAIEPIIYDDRAKRVGHNGGRYFN